jgi:HPt (histidine-containing phosphotransfer) domain-containing protein
MAIIDWDQFNENFQYYDKEVIFEVVNIFVNEYEARINTLQKNINEKDYTNLAFNAHSFKSVIGNYMASKPYELARKLEELANNNSEEGILKIFVELKHTTKELRLELMDYLRKSGNS